MEEAKSLHCPSDNKSVCSRNNIDFEIIVLMANVYLNIGDSEKALNICKKLDAFLKRSISRDRYYAHLDMLLCYTLSKYYFTTRNTALAKEYSEKARTLSVDYFIYPLKIEIFLLDKINDFMNDKTSLTAEFSYAMAAASHLECGLPLFLKISVFLQSTSRTLSRNNAGLRSFLLT